MEEILDKYFVKLVYTKHDQCYYPSDDYGFSNSNSDSEDDHSCIVKNIFARLTQYCF